MAKDMDLRMNILARGEQALSELQKVQVKIAKLQEVMTKERHLPFSDTFSKVAEDLEKIGGIAKKLTGVFFAPLRIAAEGALALGGAIGALGAKSLAAAADDEKLQQQLIAVFGSIEQGKKAFEGIEAIARRSWLPVDDLVKARIIMKQFGLDSERNLGAAANAARAAGGGVAEMAKAISILQVKHLKAFGIEVKDNDGRFVGTWRNQMGQLQKITAKSADEMRRKLMDVMAMRFGTSFQPKGLSEFWAMFKNNTEQAFAGIGGPMLDSATRFVEFISSRLRKLVESGKLEEFGKKMGDWIDRGVSWVQALSQTIPKLYEAMKASGTGFVDILMAGMGSIGRIIMVALVEGLAASASMWMGIGKMLASILREQILQLPGMGSARTAAANSKLDEMTSDDAAKLGVPLDVIGKRKAGSTDDEELKRVWKRMAWLNKQTNEQQAKIGSSGGEKDMTEGFTKVKNAIPTLMNRVKATATEEGIHLNNLIKDKTGYDFAGDTQNEYNKAQASAEEARAKKGMVPMEMVMAKRRRLLSRDNTGVESWGDEETASVLSEPGQFRKGQKVGGGGTVVDVILNLYREDDVKRIKNGLKKAGWETGLSLAGA